MNAEDSNGEDRVSEGDGKDHDDEIYIMLVCLKRVRCIKVDLRQCKFTQPRFSML